MPITLDGTLGITTPSYGGADTAEYLVPVTAFKNRLINGNMAIDQRNNGASINPTNGQYSLDRWECAVNVSNKMTVQQVSSAPSGFSYSLRVTSSSAYSIGAGEVATIRQKIEGYNMADFAWGTADAKTVTLSFWVRSSLTGTFSGVLSNDSDRTYAFTYTINAANTWEQKSVTITGPTSGTFGATNNIGVVVLFTVAAGSSLVQAAGSWQNTNNYGATGTTNLLGTNGATWQVTGTQLEVGTNATFFDARPYTTEMQLCQRYYEYGTSTFGYFNTSALAGYGMLTRGYSVQKRTASGTWTQTSFVNSGTGGLSPVVYQSGRSDINGFVYLINYTASNVLVDVGWSYSAEL